MSGVAAQTLVFWYIFLVGLCRDCLQSSPPLSLLLELPNARKKASIFFSVFCYSPLVNLLLLLSLFCFVLASWSECVLQLFSTIKADSYVSFNPTLNAWPWSETFCSAQCFTERMCQPNGHCQLPSEVGMHLCRCQQCCSYSEHLLREMSVTCPLKNRLEEHGKREQLRMCAAQYLSLSIP